ncbi:MAG TPA: hypothetical protein PLP08_09200 [Plasticicumulans sp.]|uniref:hypothetical protein n=1 Tax=Plasticicumulans sp. TaxID=2307179 RepID=UPI002C1CE544|nr:hypothetical protein [Plasticicumulans sp.]HNG49757.1 hypothetical protein [Plasticicumulans sp.]
MRRIELEMPTFPLQTRNIQLEMRDIHLEICTFPHQHRAMHDMPAPFPSSPGRVGMEICEVGLETGKVDLQERELPLESGAPYRQGCRLHLQGRESARQRHGLRRTGREFRRPRRRMRLQGHALRLQACAACSCGHRLRPSAHAVCLQARRLDGGIAHFKASAAYLHPPAASRIAPAPSRAPFLHRQGSRHRRIRTICGRPGTGMDQNAGYRGKTASEARKRADKSGNSPPECPETLLFPELVHDLDHGAGHRGRHRCFGDSKMSYRIFSTEHQGQVVSREASRPTSSQPFSTQFTAPDQPQAAEYETLYNAVSVKRHLEAVGVHGLYIREVQ